MSAPPSSPPPSDAPRWAGALRIALWIAAAVAFTGWIIEFSKAHGRLAGPPTYDDVVYLEDGLRRLHRYDAEGLGGLLGGLVDDRPHAPLSTLLSVTGFAVLGREDASPYWMNLFVLLVLVLGTDALLHGVHLPARILIGLFVLTVPLAGYAVHEFRPDIACGLLTGLGVACLTGGGLARRSRGARTRIGLLFGAAFLAKPTVFPVTGLLMGTGCLAVLLRERLARRDPVRIRDGIRASLAVVLPALALPLPYFVVHGADTWAYIVSGIWGEARVLGEYVADTPTRLRYYLTGFGGHLMLGRHLRIGLALLLGCLTWVAVTRRRDLALRIAAHGLVVLVAYTVATLNHVKTQFLGASFFALLVFGSVLLLRGVSREAESGRLPRWIGRSFLVAICVWGMWRVAPPKDYESDAIRAARTQLLGALHAAITEARTPDTGVVLFLASGSANWEWLRYEDHKDGRDPPAVSRPYLSTELRHYEAVIREADLVIACEPEHPEAYVHLPSYQVLGDTLALLRRNDAFEELARVPSSAGPAYVLFRRLAPR